MKKIILASASPRRSELLRQIGIPFTVCVSEICEEKQENELPVSLVKRLAVEKASAIAADENTIVIAADTIVAFENAILGKPADEEDAVRMLSMLSGKTHDVHTGICVRSGDQTVFETVSTKVVFRDLSAEEIKKYVQSGEPMDKAGAYGIQGAAASFVSEIHGDYYNVVGLPLCRLTEILKNFG